MRSLVFVLSILERERGSCLSFFISDFIDIGLRVSLRENEMFVSCLSSNDPSELSRIPVKILQGTRNIWASSYELLRTASSPYYGKFKHQLGKLKSISADL